MLGTFVNRTAKLGDGLVNFLTDVTEQGRMEAEPGSRPPAAAAALFASRCPVELRLA
jgi:hypothetical protein